MCSDRPSRLRGPVPKVRQKKKEDFSASGQHPPETVAGVAEYIADMSAELATLAGGADLETLAYLLNLARLEAESHAPKVDGSSN